jgi:aldehyde:ferredoxin oxidoreductase
MAVKERGEFREQGGPIMSGYCGRLLRVNLTAGQIDIEAIDTATALKLVGGRGLATYYLSREIDLGVDPVSPENKLLVATGPLTGTSVPASGRYMVVTKSPLSGTIACSNAGGYWGPEFKGSGFDMVVLEGKAPGPVTLYINDGQVEIRDAKHLWGELVRQTTEILLDEVGDPQARVLCIGPAGEKRSPIAAIISDKYRAAGRSGVGAVMGSKNLKAIVVRGTSSVRPARPEAAKEAVRCAQRKLRESDVTSKGLPTYGTAVLVNVINEAGIYPTENFQKSYFPTADQASGESLAEKYLVKKETCHPGASWQRPPQGTNPSPSV